MHKRDTRTIEEIEADLRQKRNNATTSTFTARSNGKSSVVAGKTVPVKTPARSRSPEVEKKTKSTASTTTSSEPKHRKEKTRATSEAQDRRAQIWEILNPGKKPRYYDYDSEDIDDLSDDMEAGMDEIEAEDREAERIARMEDKAEQRRLEARAKEKEERRLKLAKKG